MSGKDTVEDPTSVTEPEDAGQPSAATQLDDAAQPAAGASQVGAAAGRRGRRAGWWLYGLTVLVLVLSVGLGTVPLARSQGWLLPGGSTTISADQLQQLQPRPEADGDGVIAPVQPVLAAKRSDGAKLSAAINAVPPTSAGNFAGAAANLGGGELGYASNADQPMLPASTMKFLTSTAALEALEPSSQFRTRVVLQHVAGQATLTLVGGGDPLLASDADSHPWSSWVKLPTLAELTEQTVKVLQAQGTTKVRLTFDDSMFVGPAWHPTWHAEDRAWVAPVTALAVDLGNPAGMAEVQDPSEAAARVFAKQLTAAGITVDGDPTRAVADVGATQVAAVLSVSLLSIIEELMAVSDNYVTEVVARQLALALGKEASFTGASQALEQQLRALGLWSDGQVVADGCGLSEANRITARNLTKAIQLAASSPRQAHLLGTLPTAGASGTLTRRFGDDRAAAGRGLVRAKTGSLDDVSSLVGYAPTKDGALVAFAFLGNSLPKDQDHRAWFDQVSAAIAGCDCAE